MIDPFAGFANTIQGTVANTQKVVLGAAIGDAVTGAVVTDNDYSGIIQDGYTAIVDLPVIPLKILFPRHQGNRIWDLT